MAKTLLNMKLYYKGKVLDIAKYGRDFTKKLFIGSNKYLFWQILDPSFPDKHLFLTSTGDSFFLNLVPGSTVSCEKDGQPVDQGFLTGNNILRGTQLQLRQDMTGTVTLNPDWQVKYEFSEPWARVLTEEERQIVAQYSRRAEPTSVERFNRGMLLLFAALTIICLFIYDLALKPKDTESATLEARLSQMAQATRVVPEVAQQSSSFSDEGTPEAQTKPDVTAQQGTTARQGSATGRPGLSGTASGAAGSFGLDFSAGNTQGAVGFKAITTSETFGAARPGGRGTGGGGGSGSGAGGSGIGAPGSSFNAGAVQTNGADLGGIATTGPGVRGSSTRPTGGAISVVTGDASRVAPIGRPVTSGAIASVRGQFTAGTATTVSEGNIASVPEESRTDVENIKARVSRNKGRIQAIYNTENRITPQSGGVSVKLYINANGGVSGAEVTPQSGNLTSDFLNKVRNEVSGWSFSTTKKVVYSFSITFG